MEKQNKRPDEVVADIERQMGGRMTEATLSPEQRQVFNAICYWYEHDAISQQVLTMGGYAGTGKSTLVSVLAGRYSDVRIVFCSYTGKATSVLRTKLIDANTPGHHDVKTVHSLMYYPIPDGETGGIKGWKKRAVLEYDLIVVDEASMLDEALFNDLRSYGIPILAVGDHGQLPPVFGSFNLMEKPQLRLETIHRQAEGSPILALADFVRRIGQIPRFENSMELQQLQRHQLPEVLGSLFSTPAVNHDDIGMLCYTNRERVELNLTARQARWGIDVPMYEPTLGDQLICLKNTEGTIFNGMRGRITRCSDVSKLHYDAAILFEDDEVEVSGPVCKAQFGLETTIRNFGEFEHLTGYKPYSWDALGLLMDFGYALTVHKSQGSQFEHTIVIADTPQRISLDDRRRWLYTAVTRCSKYLVVLTP